jgi:hypothetical protein
MTGPQSGKGLMSMLAMGPPGAPQTQPKDNSTSNPEFQVRQKQYLHSTSNAEFQLLLVRGPKP